MKLSDIAEVASEVAKVLEDKDINSDDAIACTRAVLGASGDDMFSKDAFSVTVRALRPHFKGTLPAEPARKKRTPAEKGEAPKAKAKAKAAPKPKPKAKAKAGARAGILLHGGTSRFTARHHNSTQRRRDSARI